MKTIKGNHSVSPTATPPPPGLKFRPWDLLNGPQQCVSFLMVTLVIPYSATWQAANFATKFTYQILEWSFSNFFDILILICWCRITFSVEDLAN